MPDFLFGPNSLDPGEEVKNAAGWGLSKGMQGSKWAYNKLPQGVRNVTTPALQGTYNAVEPLVSKLFNTFGEAGLRGGTKIIGNLQTGQPAFNDFWNTLKTPNSSDWHNVVNNLPKATNSKLEDIIRNDVGMGLNLGADPAMWTGFGDVTKLGKEALKAGEEAANVAKGLQTGERSLAHIGGLHTPGFINKPVGKALENTGKAISNIPIGNGNKLEDILQGFKTSTNMPELNKAQQQLRKAPMNAAHINATQMEKGDAKVIDAVSKKTGLAPEVLHKQMMEYIEPAESQAALPEHLSEEAFQKQIDKVKGIQQKMNATKSLPMKNKLKSAFNVEGNNLEMMNHEKQGIEDAMRAKQDAIGKTLHPDIKALADKHIEDYKGFNASEGGKTRSYYVEHNPAPEWSDFKQKFLPKLDMPKGEKVDNIGKAIHDAMNARTGAFKDFTANEVNNLSEQGKLRELPGGALKDMKVLDKFKGKVFDDNAVRIHAQRYLENATANTTKEFEDHIQKTYGIPFRSYDDKLDKGEIKSGDYVEDPKTDSWYPKEVARAIEKMRDLKTSTGPRKAIGQTWNNFNDLTKKLYFGAFPASVSKIYLGNQILAFMSGLWHPVSQAKGLAMAVGMRWDSIPSKVQSALKLAGFGPLSAEDAKLLETLKQNRGYGMGMARYESPQLEKSKGFFKMMWNGHNLAEDATRIGTTLEAMRQGYNPFAASKASRKALYDYSDLSEMDQMGKKLAPFYTFQRKNAENMAKLWLKNPGRLGLPLKLQNEGDQDFQNQRQNWSSSKAEGTAIPFGQLMNKSLGTNLDNNLQLQLNSVWPANDINRWTGTGKTLADTLNPTNVTKSVAKTAVGMVNPFIRVPGEVAGNYNLNAGQPIEKFRGQVAPLPFVGDVSKRLLQYPLSQLRIANDPLLPFTNKIDAPWQIGTRLAAGLSFHNADPQQEANFSNIENRHELRADKALPKFFLKEAIRQHRKGNEEGAKAAYENEKLSYEQARKQRMGL